MEIKWTDEKSVIKIGKEIYQAGDMLPADELNMKLINRLRREKKIRVIEPEPFLDDSNCGAGMAINEEIEVEKAELEKQIAEEVVHEPVKVKKERKKRSSKKTDEQIVDKVMEEIL